MNNKKQSSIEWLVNVVQSHIVPDYIPTFIVEKAKAMHKEEQRLTYEGVAQNLGTSIKESDIPTFEEYYNETFKK